MTRWRRAVAGLAVVAAAVSLWVLWPRATHDAVADRAVATMEKVADRVRQDPERAYRTLPDDVSVYYARVGSGQQQLRGWLYRPLPDGRCAVVEVAVTRDWLQHGAAAGVRVSDPTLTRGCPGDQ